MFVIGRVVDARRKQHAHRLVHSGRGYAAQHLEQGFGIVDHWLHLTLKKQIGQDTFGGQAVREHVAHARRTPQVVFQHVELPVFVTDHVGARNVDVHSAVGHKISHTGGVVLGGEDELFGNYPVLQDFLFVIDVLQKQIKRVVTLGESALNGFPLRGLNDAWKQVERKDAFYALGTVGVHIEGDTLVEGRFLGVLV